MGPRDPWDGVLERFGATLRPASGNPFPLSVGPKYAIFHNQFQTEICDFPYPISALTQN